MNPEAYGRVVCVALLHNMHNNYICIWEERGIMLFFTMEPLGVLRCVKKGFITENGYFVNRETALYIATYFN